jgi:hypothetical protein
LRTVFEEAAGRVWGLVEDQRVEARVQVQSTFASFQIGSVVDNGLDMLLWETYEWSIVKLGSVPTWWIGLMWPVILRGARTGFEEMTSSTIHMYETWMMGAKWEQWLKNVVLIWWLKATFGYFKDGREDTS